MSIFSKIISLHFPNVDIKKPAFSYKDGTKTTINKDFIAYGFVNALEYNYKYNKLSKFALLKNSIVNNIFVHINKKNDYLDIFSKAQRIYYSLCRLARLFKLKHAIHYDMNTDLCMTPLSNFKKTVLIDLYDDMTKTIYKFRMSDLLNIIQTSLSNSPDFFSEPLTIKNPYTNVSFTYAQLYYIYFRVRYSDFIMPTLFHQFFLSGFNIGLFTKYNECYIRNVAIKILY